jgi:hypothetical protein
MLFMQITCEYFTPGTHLTITFPYQTGIRGRGRPPNFERIAKAVENSSSSEEEEGEDLQQQQQQLAPGRKGFPAEKGTSDFSSGIGNAQDTGPQEVVQGEGQEEKAMLDVNNEPAQGESSDNSNSAEQPSHLKQPARKKPTAAKRKRRKTVVPRSLSKR